MESGIRSFEKVVPMIYAYETPGVTYHEGWIKIGYTEKQSVADRINQQTHTAGLRWVLDWQDNAMYKDGTGDYFTDHDFHDYLEGTARVPRESGTEWFKIDSDSSQLYFNKFASRKTKISHEGSTYVLRKEQKEAVDKTFGYFKSGGAEFLWNAKPRFGKTLSAYDLVVQMGFTKVLIVTNRPSIANSWADDFNKFIGWQHNLAFISDTDALKGKNGVISREEYIRTLSNSNPEERYKGFIAFESLQGLKGSVYFGGQYDKLGWLAKEYKDYKGEAREGITFDLLIIDESHEGVKTAKTERAFKNISRKHTLYLSGTPFKALASGEFSDEQIFNWSYADEQESKENWNGDDYNPYESLPRLCMFTYQLSNMIYDEVKRGIDLTDEGDSVDYAFDLNEFFATNANGSFIHEQEIKKFLHALSTQEKYPYSTPELRAEMSHTLWLLNRVASAKALEKLLRDDPVFGEYKVIIAAGDGKSDEDVEVNDKSFDRVIDAIAKYDKTITLSVGQLTVGVTIPEWSGVLMLCNLKSAPGYMQAAFRVQNPCALTKDGKRLRKERAYVFDFDPARTLVIFDEFANNLTADMAKGGGTSEDRKQNIKRLLNFFPVLGEDEEGKMIELDAAKVLSIPRRIKSVEVVRRGFMSNFLFQNIGNVFGAPAAVTEIMSKLIPAKEEKPRKKKEELASPEGISLDENGDVEIPNEIVIGKTRELFGDKIYEDMADEIYPAANIVAEKDPDMAHIRQQTSNLTNALKETVTKQVFEPAAESYDLGKSAGNKIIKSYSEEIDRAFEMLEGDYEQKINIAKAEHDKAINGADTEEEVKIADAGLRSSMDAALETFNQSAKEQIDDIINNKPAEIVKKLEQSKREKEKKGFEEQVRSRLRGFSRTIPSFIMAYGDGYLTLRNFDDYTEDDVFEEVTGITEDDFRFLRDGGEYKDENGESQHFEGNLFDEVVFDDSITEFWRIKSDLADYFDESKSEDIFDYIPPQRTNQIFTPKWVVQMMVDKLEEENPGCFDDPDNTFADLYMKSGLYITEIVKRLFRSPRMRELFPDDSARIRYIIRNQVYGMAPTRIIYLIAINYILGFDEKLKAEISEEAGVGTAHFVQADAAKAAKEGKLEELVEECFGFANI